jgi:ABC-2 type transport system permease protein
MMRALGDVWLFFLRDLAIARTYRTLFVMEGVEALFGAAMFYYVARFVDTPQLQRALPQGGSYFAFSLVGFVFLDYLNAALDTFDRSLEDARDSGTLEHLLVTQTSLPVFVAGSAIYPFAATTLRIAIYVAWAALLFAFPIGAANWFAVFAVLLVALLAFSGLGILSASYLLIFKRGNPAKWFFLGISSVAGGILFPVNMLPDWLQVVARLHPVTYALEAMRAALLGGATLAAQVKEKTGPRKGNRSLICWIDLR